jgi:hypothetical protein
MARRRRETKLTPEQKKQARKIKRELRKANAAETGLAQTRKPDVPEKTPHVVEQHWMWIRERMRANEILNRSHVRPYWLSIPEGMGGRDGPIAPFYPCGSFVRGGRRYYGFSFRDHRNRCFTAWRHTYQARKEMTGPGQIPLFPSNPLSID